MEKKEDNNNKKNNATFVWVRHGPNEKMEDPAFLVDDNYPSASSDTLLRIKWCSRVGKNAFDMVKKKCIRHDPFWENDGSSRLQRRSTRQTGAIGTEQKKEKKKIGSHEASNQKRPVHNISMEPEKKKQKGTIVSVDIVDNGYCSDASQEEVVYWEVDTILKRKQIKGEEYFLVKWKSDDSGEHVKPTWEPSRNLNRAAHQEIQDRFEDLPGRKQFDSSSFNEEPTMRPRPCVERFRQLYQSMIDDETTWKTKGDASFLLQWENKQSAQTSFDVAYVFPVEKQKSAGSSNGRTKPRCLELFSGAGGMSLGLEVAGLETTWIVDKNPIAVATQQVLHPEATIYQESVEEFLEKVSQGQEGYPSAKDVDHIHLSPPCQGFSLLNRYGGQRRENNNESRSIIKAIKLLQPSTATFENVEGILRPSYIHYIELIVEKIVKMGYSVRISVLNSCFYGDPQKRKRMILVATRKGWPLPDVPPPTHGFPSLLSNKNNHLLPIVTVEDAICDLEGIVTSGGGVVISPQSGNIIHNHQVTESMKVSPMQKDHRVCRDKPCPTICCDNRLVHYSLNRKLTVRELARLMGFPDSFKFFGTLAEQYKQVGNAVPVNLATAVAKSVMSTCYER